MLSLVKTYCQKQKEEFSTRQATAYITVCISRYAIARTSVRPHMGGSAKTVELKIN